MMKGTANENGAGNASVIPAGVGYPPSSEDRHHEETQDDAPAGARGVLAKNGAVSPRSDDVSRGKITLRDALVLLGGALAMYGAQLATTYGLRSDIRDIKTVFEAKLSEQDKTNGSLQRQIDNWIRETNLNRVNIANNERELAEIKGILYGSGMTKGKAK